jgi:hypothetical protein
MAAALAGPNPGTLMLRAGRLLRLELDLARQTATCDFPSGRWTFEISYAALIRQVKVEVPLDGTDGRLIGPIEEIRLCLLDAAGVHNMHGEIGG